MINPDFSLPVAVPLRFFRTAPWWLLLAALLFAGQGEAVLASRHHPATLAITHLLMLGFAGNVMIGALMQVSAVVAGVRAQRPVLAGWLVWGALQAGTALLAAALWWMQPVLLQLAGLVLGTLLLAFPGWLFARLWRSPATDASTAGLRWAVAGLALTAVCGILLALSLAGRAVAPLALPGLLRLHVLLGSMGWVFPLLASVALTVVPMFLVTPPWPPRVARLLVPLNALALLAGAAWPPLLPLVALPVLAFVLYLLRLLAASKRDADPARWLWAWGGANLLLVCALTAGTGAEAPLNPTLLGGQFLFGALLPILTAMLGKIVPFLLWLDYRLSVPVGRKLRHMGQLFPERWLRGLGALALALGLAWPLASVSRWPLLALLPVYALALAGAIHVACRRARRATESSPGNRGGVA